MEKRAKSIRKTIGLGVCCIAAMIVLGSNNAAYAQENAKCTITFDADGGTISEESRKVELGQAVGELPVPEKEGYEFKGWLWIDQNGTYLGEVNKDTVMEATSGAYFFDNSSANWDSVYLFAWSDEECDWAMEKGFDLWPGKELTIDSSTGYYCFTDNDIPDDVKLIFSNGDENGDEKSTEETSTDAKSGMVYSITGVNDDAKYTGTWSKAENYKQEDMEVTFYANWKWNGVEIIENNVDHVHFSVTDGTVSELSRDVIRGQAVGKLPVPEKDGYTFDGWYTDATGGEKISDSTVIYTENASYSNKFYFDNSEVNWDGVSVWAWSNANPMWPMNNGFEAWPGIELLKDSQTGYYVYDCPKYEKGISVMFNDNGRGSQTSDDSAMSAVPGRVFRITSVDDEGMYYGIWDYVEKPNDITYYAHWTENSCQITFDKNGGNTLSKASITVNADSKIGALPVTARTGYTFKGWFTKKTGGTKVTSETVIKENMKLYAQWSINKYTVKFDKNGGTTPSKTTISVNYGAKIGTLPKTTRAGYIFEGWYTTKTGGKKISVSTVCNGNVTYYAHWAKVKVSQAAVKNISAGSKKISVTVNKMTGAKGYQIRYSKSSKMKSAKSVSITSTAKTIKSLAGKTKYYVQVRAYKLDSCGNKVYGSWSKVKSVTTRK